MDKHYSHFIHGFNTTKNNDYKLNLFKPKSDKDWSQAIHHDLNIKRRTCTTFIPKSSTDDGKTDVQCGCSRLRREHSWDVLEGTDKEWNKELHTTSAYNNAYGFMPHTHAHYIRCDIQTHPDTLVRLMFHIWRMKEPRLIMCIIGGAKYFKLNERLEREFIKGIIQAALRADGWIVTSGFKTGVVQLVGEAIYDHKVTNPRSQITAIGCSKWGAAKNRQSLISTKVPNKTAQDATMERGKRPKGQQELEPNHTHFLLLDDGTYYNYDIGYYRTRFVIQASRYENKDIPVVTIVVEGGPDTLTTIYKDLINSIPIVLIDGSGRVPNLLANFLSRTDALISRLLKGSDGASWKQVIDISSQNDIEKLKTAFSSYEEEIRDGLKEISLGSKTSAKIDRLYESFLFCLQPAVRSKIRVYSLDSESPLDDTIFEAIIEAKQQESSEKNKTINRGQLLRLALAWNAIDVAKEHIIKDDLSDLSSQAKSDLFYEALQLDRPQFINAFLKQNFDIAEMFYEKQINQPWKLRSDRLLNLYNNDDKKIGERLYLLKRFLGNRHILHPDGIDQILKKLVGDYMKSIYAPSSEIIRERVTACCPCSGESRVADSRAILYSTYADNDSEVPDPEEARKEVREVVLRDLFLWSILTNRIEMAKVFLSYMQARICAALIASEIIQSYRKYAYDNESKDVLTAQSDQFQEYANEFLKCCYNYDEEKACEIAIRRIKVFGNVTCLQVAVDADAKSFVGQPCCDQLLNNVWYDKIEHNQLSVWQRVNLCLNILTFGLIAPALIKFRENQPIENYPENDQKDYAMTVNETEDDTQDLLPPKRERLAVYGINYSDTHTSRIPCFSGLFCRYFRRLKHFHQSPFIKFIYHCFSYIFFLLLFSYFLLFDFTIPTEGDPRIHWTEILVTVIISTMLCEELREFSTQENRSFCGKIRHFYGKNAFSTIIRLASYVLFYIGFILRFVYASTDGDLSAARIFYAYDLEIWFIRSLTFLGVVRKMGPKIVMIRKMLIDLFFFTYIILIAMIAYGVTSRSMYKFGDFSDTYDNLTFDGRSVFRNILYPSYYLMYGSQDNELSALNASPDAATAMATQILLAFHMLVVNILLINLLIAMFSFTFDLVQTQTDLVWRFERYSLIREYYDRPPLFPPVYFISHVYEFILFLIRYCSNSKYSTMRRRRAKIFKMVGAHRDVDKDWSEFESYATNLYARTIVSGQPSSAAALVPSTARQEVPQTSLDIINASQILSNIDLKAVTDEMSVIRRAIGDLRTQSDEMNRCMQWMMDAMERVKMSKEPKPKIRSAFTTNDE